MVQLGSLGLWLHSIINTISGELHHFGNYHKSSKPTTVIRRNYYFTIIAVSPLGSGAHWRALGRASRADALGDTLMGNVKNLRSCSARRGKRSKKPRKPTLGTLFIYRPVHISQSKKSASVVLI